MLIGPYSWPIDGLCGRTGTGLQKTYMSTYFTDISWEWLGLQVTLSQWVFHLPFLQMGQHWSGSYTGSTHSVWGQADTVHSTSPLASQRHRSHGDTWDTSPWSGSHLPQSLSYKVISLFLDMKMSWCFRNNIFKFLGPVFFQMWMKVPGVAWGVNAGIHWGSSQGRDYFESIPLKKYFCCFQKSSYYWFLAQQSLTLP